MREHRRIRLNTPPRRWTASEIKMLGQLNDCEVARRLRRSPDEVRRQRIRLGVPPLRPQHIKKWTRAEEKLLGIAPDREVARRLGRSAGSVRAHRLALGLHKYHLIIRQWTPGEEKLLGTAEDKVIAALLHRARGSVSQHRRRLGIPPRPRIFPNGWTAEQDSLLGKPVSYTHLDVYKRQPTSSANGKLFVHFGKITAANKG